ncbi:MAG: hypothetical protein RLZZ88_744 [Actinomycetota bacterium]|jgi:ectoine hydroxylase
MTSDSQLKADFEAKGFVLTKGLFSGEQAASACQWLLKQDPNSLRKSWTEAEPGVPLAIYSVIHEESNPIGAIATDQRITSFAGRIMGEPTYIWSSKVNVKAAWCGTVEYYHQDFIYWRDRGYPTDRMLSCMVFLQPHGLANAGLHVIPGSHTSGLLEHEPFINTNGLAKWMIPTSKLDQLYDRNGIHVVEAEPGDALFFHTSLVHGSSHNISPHGRMICLVQMNTASNEPRGVPLSAKDSNLRRARREVEEAKRRLDYFSDKLRTQEQSAEITFGAPIPREERM